jgi:dihydrodipicolinate synthase/N-acetylneuraminate lyase
VKWAASQLGLCAADVRLPMVHATDNAQKRVRAAMEHVGLLPVKKAAAAE